jgi:uncharacterized membrane protein SpoIIM required for sporulation
MMVKKNSWKNEFGELFLDSWKYIAEHKKYIYFVTTLFFMSSIFGYLNAGQLSFLDKSLIEIAQKTEGLDALELVWFIFANNVTSSVSCLFLGIILGIFPLFNAILM